MIDVVIEVLKAIAYGILEGITEWLPISSTGHMLLFNQLVTLNVSEAFWNMFLVVIQLGAILAVCVYFFHFLNPCSRKKTARELKDIRQLWAKIFVACLPAAIIGIPFHDWISAHLETPRIVASALIIFGVIFIVIELVRKKKAETYAVNSQVLSSRGRHFAVPDLSHMNSSELADTHAPVQTLKQLDWFRVFGIGCFQVLSLIPGTSRSGSTIVGGLLLGCSRVAVTEFTFYLAVPVMFGASALKLGKFILKGNVFTQTELIILVTGCIAAFVVSLIVIRFLMRFVKKHTFISFGWYRIALGIAVLAYFFAGGSHI